MHFDTWRNYMSPLAMIARRWRTRGRQLSARPWTRIRKISRSWQRRAADRFKQARENGLLIRWSRGGRLLQSEFEEVRHPLPADAVQAFERLFSDDSVRNELGNARYEKPLIEYQAILGRRSGSSKDTLRPGSARRTRRRVSLSQSFLR